MSEQTVFESESRKTPAEVATLLHHLGDCLRDDSSFSFQQDDRTTTISVPSELSVSVEVERETGDNGHDETEVEIELEWDTSETDTESADDAERPRKATPIAESLDPARATRASLGRFEVYRDTADEWRWRLVHRNGNIIATSGEGYTSRQNAEKGLRSVMANAPDADVTTEET
ncbi:HVO_2922 family protein [Halomicrococcus sp. SG-WS-1]|uniref:HVO_2922 family protein n=1 Tax=Halomicrococcus sp. SG-WS-1 TaxID=3439057 RepID=UPI003F78BFA2